MKRGTNTYRPSQPAPSPQPWSLGLIPGGNHAHAFKPIVIRETTAIHCFSVCLYHEPLYTTLFPQRSFTRRYLEEAEAIREHLATLGYALNIFTDDAMLDSALELDLGSVYRVTTPKRFPFHQHIYRYLSALLPPHPTIRAYHFRGLDNLLIDQAEQRHFDALLANGLDLIHAPYIRPTTGEYVTVKGSCSVANQGIHALAHWLKSTPQQQPLSHTALWHNDETHLSDWLASHGHHLKPLIVIDRPLPMDFYADMHRKVTQGQPFNIVRI